jgi:DNA-binding MarR family transcriptional regulator
MANEIVSTAGEARQARVKRVADALRTIVKLAQEATEGAARDGGLHPTDFECIGFLFAAQRALSPRDIIAHLGISSSSGTALLDRLEKQGYVRRLPNPGDRRSVLISLDEEAARGVIGLHAKIDQFFLEVTSDLSMSDLEIVADFLARIPKLAAFGVSQKSPAE